MEIDLSWKVLMKCSATYRTYPTSFNRVDTNSWIFLTDNGPHGKYWITNQDPIYMPLTLNGLHLCCTNYLNNDNSRTEVKFFMIVDFKILVYNNGGWVVTDLEKTFHHVKRWQDKQLQDLKNKQMNVLQQLQSHCDLWGLPLDLLSMIVNYSIGVTFLDMATSLA